MNKISLPDEHILGTIELLSFVADLCSAQDTLVSAALVRFLGTSSYDAAELHTDASNYADRLATALGFADASLERAP
jgi:hypothetical protein